MTRRGVTLVEILVASGVLAALMLPLLTLFSSTTRRIGTELHFTQAAALADELMTQVGQVHARLGRLESVPGRGHAGGRAPGGELDLETYLRAAGDPGVVALLPATPADARGSMLALSPTVRGYRRFLTIAAAQTSDPRPNTAADTLWLARVRVEFDLTLDGRDFTREVLLQSYYFQKCAPDAKFAPPE